MGANGALTACCFLWRCEAPAAGAGSASARAEGFDWVNGPAGKTGPESATAGPRRVANGGSFDDQEAWAWTSFVGAPVKRLA